MKKRLLALLLAVSMLLLSSCSYTDVLKSLLEKIVGPKSNRDAEISFDFDDSVLKKMDDRYTKMDALIAKNDLSDYNEFEKLYNEQMADYYYLADQMNLAFVTYAKDTSNKEASDKYDELTDEYNSHYNRLTAMYRPIYECVFKDSFYADWSEKDIDEALMRSDASGPEMEQLNNDIDAEIKRYQDMDDESETYNKDSADAYYNIVHMNIDLAKRLGFDSYVEYAYKYVYTRDYTPEDAQKMYDYVKRYIVPLSEVVISELRDYKKLRTLEKEYSAISSRAMKEEDLLEKLTPYYDTLGGKTPDAFKCFMKNHFVSSEENGLSNAFTQYLYYYERPICFFGPDVQGLLTYVHEQGHFTAFYAADSSIASFDLCEVQSQGNEWLYLTYIKDNYDAAMYEYLAKYHLYDSLITIILATCCDAFEQYVYSHPELSADEYDQVFINEAKKMGAYSFLKNNISIPPEDYWHLAIVSNSIYYLSYAVSKIPSIEVYVKAQNEGFNAAVADYMKLLDVDYEAEFVSTLEACGFTSPFSEEAYKQINNCFNKKS